MFAGSFLVGEGRQEMTPTDLWQWAAIGLLSVVLVSLCVALYRFMNIVRDFLIKLLQQEASLKRSSNEEN